MRTQKITNWSNYPSVEAYIHKFDHEQQLKGILASGNDGFIVRGSGRCYGDASLAKNIIDGTTYNNFLSFDRGQGILECQSGVTLSEIIDVFLPQGWFIPVTPGTKFITIGGAIASDVHGKNHHKEGSFSNHILSMRIYTGAGEVIECSKTRNSELFYATCGGMGLTGVVLSAKIRLKKVVNGYIERNTEKAQNLDQIFEKFMQNDNTYSMAWIDCFQKKNSLGKSILFSGEHSQDPQISKKVKRKKTATMPFNFPAFTLNKFSIKAFNYLYYAKHSTSKDLIDFDTFFYPLDSILQWNRLYGKKGFVQYQFVLPLESSREGLGIILKKIESQNLGSFLAVLKLFGEQNDLINFPMRGFTLALDFPVRRSTFRFLNELDHIVHDFGGRIYFSKDARGKPELLKKGYPKFDEWMNIVKQYNPEGRFRSDLAKRLEFEL